MKIRYLLIFGLLVVATASHSAADVCAVDDVPAATLLLPYFEVSLSGSTDVNTLFSINNALPDPALVNVVLWTDWGLPTFHFDVFLTGYDVQAISLASLFREGNLPRTAHSTNDQGNVPGFPVPDTISPHGLNPEWDSAPDNSDNMLFPGCDVVLPHGSTGNLPALNAEILERVRNSHLGNPIEGECRGHFHGDDIVRGFVTIDNVTNCDSFLPTLDGYFGSGLVSDVNQLYGDFYMINAMDGFAFGDNLVHIEASSDAFAPGDYTFYGRYVDGLGSDNREPLGTSWAVRYLNGGGFDGGTDLIVWRDTKFDSTHDGFSCSNGPDWFPLNETQVVAFDEEELASEICQPAPGTEGGVSPPPNPTLDPTCFELATGRYRIGGGDLAVPYDFGWLFLNLNFALASGGTNDGLFGSIAQSYVLTNPDSFDANLSVGFPAVELSGACSDENPLVVGNL